MLQEQEVTRGTISLMLLRALKPDFALKKSILIRNSDLEFLKNCLYLSETIPRTDLKEGNVDLQSSPSSPREFPPPHCHCSCTAARSDVAVSVSAPQRWRPLVTSQCPRGQHLSLSCSSRLWEKYQRQLFISARPATVHVQRIWLNCLKEK